MSAPSTPPDWTAQKQRRGVKRLAHAAGYSVAGLLAGWREAAFRLEVLAGLPMMVASLWLGRNWVEVVLLAGSVTLVMIAELLNTAIESTVDRISTQWDALAKRAKDLGSAAVFLSVLLCLAIWGSALWMRFA